MISPARETRADGDPRGACALPLGNPSALTPLQAGEIFFFKSDKALTAVLGKKQSTIRWLIQPRCQRSLQCDDSTKVAVIIVTD